MKVEHPSGNVESIAIRLSYDQFDFSGRPSRVASLVEGEHQWWLPGFGQGLSGSPVFSQDGTFRGALWNSIYDSAGPAAIVTAEAVRGALETAKFALPSVASAMSSESAQACFNPGEAVGALYLWGDKCAGAYGIVSYTEGDALVMLAHHIELTTVGPRNLALCSARMLTGVSTTAGIIFAFQAEEVSGTVLADTPCGTVAVAGLDPNGVALDVSCEFGGVLQRRQYWMARDPLYAPRAVTTAIEDLVGLRQADSYLVVGDIFDASGLSHYSVPHPGVPMSTVLSDIRAILSAEPERLSVVSLLLVPKE